MKTHRYTITLLVLAAGAWHAAGQTAVDLSRQGKLGTGTTLPVRCTVGQVFFLTNAAAGANLYACTTPNTWSVMGLPSLGGDASGTQQAMTVQGIQGRSVSTASPADQNVLRWNAGTGQWQPAPVPAIGTTGPPATCAAGSLYLRSDAANNIQQLYVCSNTNTWTMTSTAAGLAANRPVNCVAGQTWLSTDAGAMTYCSATGNPGTWSALAGGAGVQSDWNAASGPAQILNKPALGGAATLNVGTAVGTVAAGNYADGGMGPAYVVNPKGFSFGCVGNGVADDTTCFQAALNALAGTAGSHTSDRTLNRYMYVPPGTYKITSPLALTYAAGIHILGSGRFTTKIVNTTSGSTVLSINGLGYSSISGIYFQATGAAVVIDCNWDGTGNGGAALQSDQWEDLFIAGDATAGGIGFRLANSQYMGSEQLWLNCFFYGNALYGLQTGGMNAVDNTLLGGDFQWNGDQIYIPSGAISTVHGVSFQKAGMANTQTGYDIHLGASSAGDTMDLAGIRTESINFFKDEGHHSVKISGSSQTEASNTNGYFYNGNSDVHILDCMSYYGQINLTGGKAIVENFIAGRNDWIAYSGGFIYVEYAGITYNNNVSPQYFTERHRVVLSGQSSPYTQDSVFTTSYIAPNNPSAINTTGFVQFSPGTLWFDNTDPNNLLPYIETTSNSTSQFVPLLPNTVSLTPTIPDAANNYVSLGQYVINAGPPNRHSAAFSIVAYAFSAAAIKSYSISAVYAGTANVWQTLVPSSSTGAGASGDDFALDINIGSDTVYFRLRRTAGSLTGQTGWVSITEISQAPDLYVACSSSCTGTVSAPTVVYKGGANPGTISNASGFAATLDPTNLTASRTIALPNVGGTPMLYQTNTTGSTAFAPAGSNCPATNCVTPYTWMQVTTSDGSTGYMPVFK